MDACCYATFDHHLTIRHVIIACSYGYITVCTYYTVLDRFVILASFSLDTAMLVFGMSGPYHSLSSPVHINEWQGVSRLLCYMPDATLKDPHS